MKFILATVAAIAAYSVVRIGAMAWFGIEPSFGEVMTVLVAVMVGDVAYQVVSE